MTAFPSAAVLGTTPFAVQCDVGKLMATSDLRARKCCADAPEGLRGVGTVIEEARLDRNQLVDLPVDQPRTLPINHSQAVEAAPHVQPFTGRNQTPRAKVHLMTSDPKSERFPLVAEFQIEECLVHFQSVVVGRPRSSVAPGADRAWQLSKDAGSLAEMRIGVQQVTLQQVTVLILCTSAEIKLAEVFVPKPGLTAERDIPAPCVHWDVFHGVDPFRPLGFVFQIAPVLFISQRLKWRRGVFTRVHNRAG